MTQVKENQSIGGALIALGILLIALRLMGFTMMSLLWPLWVLIPGTFLLFTGVGNGRAQLGWAVPGAIITGTGGILMLLNVTGRWEAWAYIWALYPIFVGMALKTVGERTYDEDMVEDSKKAIRGGLYMLLSFGLFFELMVFSGFAFLDNLLLPLLLIGAGVYFLSGQGRLNMQMGNLYGDKRKNSDPDTGIDPKLRREMDDAIYSDDAATPEARSEN